MREEKLGIASWSPARELDQTADHIELALEGVLILEFVRCRDKHLADERLRRACRLARVAIVGGDVAPPDHTLALFLDGLLDQLLELDTALVLCGQEHDADRVAPGRRQLDPGGDATEKRVRDLQQDARAVTGVRVGPGGTAVLEIAESLQTLLDDCVRRLAPELGDQRDTTGVVFVGWVVEASGPLCGGYLIHGGERGNARGPRAGGRKAGALT